MEYCNIVIKQSEIPMGLVELKGTYKYSTRMPSPVPEKYMKKKQNLEGIMKRRPSRILSAIIESAAYELKEYNSSSDHTNRYTHIMPSIPLDKYNNLEILGSMSYSKTKTFTYTLHDKLDYALAYLFNTPLELVRERLLLNCERLGIDYEILSYAFCSMNMEYLEQINLQVLLGISDILDSYIMNIIWQPHTCIFAVGDAVISLTDPEYTDEERITTFMLAKIGYFLQLFTNAIIMQFKNEREPFIGSRNCMLVSKGPSNVVIALAGYNCLPVITFELDNLEPIKVAPQEAYSIGEYNESNWYNKILQ